MSMDPERLRKLEDIAAGMGVGPAHNDLVVELLFERDDLAREAERAWAHAKAVARAADGHKAEAERLKDGEVAWAKALGLAKAEAERLRGERDRLQERLDRAADVVQDLVSRARSSDALADGYVATDRPNVVSAARCSGKGDGYVHAADMLTNALRASETGAPEGKQP